MNESKTSLSGRQFGAVASSANSPMLQLAATSLNSKLVLCARPEALSANPVAVDFVHRVLTGGVDLVVFQSEFGVNEIISISAKLVQPQRFLEGLSDIKVVATEEPVARVLRKHGVESDVVKSGSWRELLMFLDRHFTLANMNVGVEQFVEFQQIAAGLESRGCRVVPIPVFDAVANAGPWVADLERLVTAIDAGELALLFLQSPADVEFFVRHAHRDSVRQLSELLSRTLVIAGDSETRMLLQRKKLRGDFMVLDSAGEGSFSDRIESVYGESLGRRRFQSVVSERGIQRAPLPGKWDDGPFMKACRGEETDVTPIWMMRQAGRYMKEYRAVREGVPFLDLCANPQLCSEVMCTAVEKLGVDAAIIFSDLLPILVPMGCDLEFVKGDGPVIHNPVRESRDLDRIRPLETLDELEFVMETVRQTRKDLPDAMPLIGFAGAPFTLASYMIEGGASRSYEHTKRLMYSDQGAWHELMMRLTDSVSLYLNGQVVAGAQCLQLFDSWAGCLNYEDYRLFVLPYVKQIIDRIPFHVPIINFATGNPALLPLLADTQASVIGVDWRIRLDDAWQVIGHDRSVQGNLDPTVLLTDAEFIRSAAKSVLAQAGGRKGHIFNLGHGILPSTPVENAIALVDAVHELSQK